MNVLAVIFSYILKFGKWLLIIDVWIIRLFIDWYIHYFFSLPKPIDLAGCSTLFKGSGSPLGHISFISCWSLFTFTCHIVALCSPGSHPFLNIPNSGGLNCSELAVLMDWLASTLLLLAILLYHYTLIMVYWWCLWNCIRGQMHGLWGVEASQLVSMLCTISAFYTTWCGISDVVPNNHLKGRWFFMHQLTLLPK